VKELEALESLEDLHRLLPGCGVEEDDPQLLSVPLWDGARLVVRANNEHMTGSVNPARLEVVAVRGPDV